MNSAKFAVVIGIVLVPLFLQGPIVRGQDALEGTEAKFTNARVEKRKISRPLAQEMRELEEKTIDPAWVGYAVAMVPGNRMLCCGNYNVSKDRVAGKCGTCRLERSDKEANVNWTNDDESGSALPRILVLFRIANKKVELIRVFSESCKLDAGGRTVIWLAGVKPAESVAWLETFVRSDGQQHSPRGLGDIALTAMALHEDSATDRSLESLVATDQPEELRKRVSFWLGAARGKAGLAALEKMARSDPSSQVRGDVAFAFSISQEPRAVDDLIRMAHDDGNSYAREQALFWLAQKAGQKAAAAITGAIENDPNEEVKEKAVFALSQLPEEEGVPKLIEVAQTNHNAEVRKKAMFWLGQSGDPRALAFFEKVLSQ